MIYTADYPANWNPLANNAADSAWRGAAMSMFAKGGRAGTRPFAIKTPREHLEYMAKGGLAQQAKNVAGAGVGGDTMVIHINKDEYHKLKSEWGEPTINPHTGLPQFTPFWKQHWFAPVAALVGTALMATGVGAPLGEGLLTTLGAGEAATTGLGAATGIGALGGTTVGTLAGNTLIGAGIGGLTGGAKGALTSGLLAGAGTVGSSALGNYLTGGGYSAAPSQGATDVPIPTPRPTGDDLAQIGGDVRSGFATPASSGGGGSGMGFGTKVGNFLTNNPGALAAAAVTLGDMMGGGGSSQPADASTAATQKSADPNLTRSLAIAPLTRKRIPNLGNTYFTYGQIPEQSFFADNSILQQQDTGQQDTPSTVKAAHGGPLSHYVQGGGTGRSDSIDAKLSDGEYVIDAETVALLGDGSSKAGAQKLDKFRANIRKQKGKALAQGKFSPDARNPEQYMMGGRA
jgi:hypothetical protein